MLQHLLDSAIEHHRAGRLAEAEAIYRQILSAQPNDPNALHLLGLVSHQIGRGDQAVDLIRRAIAANPGIADIHANLAVVLSEQGQIDEAIDAYRRALELNPSPAGRHSSLARLLHQVGRFAEAIAAFRQAAALQPDSAEAPYNLAKALHENDEFDEAIVLYRKALALRPDYAQAFNNLGNALKETGQVTEAIECYRRAVDLKASPRAASNLLYALYFLPEDDPTRIRREHDAWAQTQARPSPRTADPATRDRDAGSSTRIRIGYVSPDFRRHVVGFNMLPLFREHDHGGFEIFCYSNVPSPDELTDRFRSYADQWRDIQSLTDDQAADVIRADRIDILVDLALHMSDNRLPVFARKPAAVQATFAGYPGTTGLRTVDYRLTDPYLDPPGNQDNDFVETPIRLPDSFWCYDPPSHEPPVNELPAASNGFITLGCLNNFSKVNALILELWARILAAVDRSRLLMLAPPGSSRDRVRHHLLDRGIDPARVEFVFRQPREQYLRTYHRIDLGLDTFPYNGHTTTIDSLWMGVPVVSLAGSGAVSRGGLSILSNICLSELAASSPDEFVRIAVALAGELSRLAELRRTLRTRLLSFPLTNAKRFARNIEAAYLTMLSQHGAGRQGR